MVDLLPDISAGIQRNAGTEDATEYCVNDIDSLVFIPTLQDV